MWSISFFPEHLGVLVGGDKPEGFRVEAGMMRQQGVEGILQHQQATVGLLRHGEQQADSSVQSCWGKNDAFMFSYLDPFLFL